MKQTDTTIRLSPSDLSNHLACQYLTALDLEVAMGRRQRPVVHSQFLDMLRARGDDHEKAYVGSLRQNGLSIVDLSAAGQRFSTPTPRLSEESLAMTREAMASGADLIVQAPLGEDGWGGYADILRRVETRSDLGAWSYEAVDTKLARETRGGTVLQLCVYSDLIRRIQGRRPDHFHVVSPGEPFLEQPYRLDDFDAYYRLVRGRLEGAVGTGIGAAVGGTDVLPSCCPEPACYPEPVPHCDICRWQAHCESRRRRDDHLSLVAGIRRTQRAELTRQGVTTLTALAGVPLPLPFTPDRGSRESMTRMREQARVQLAGRISGAPHHELLPIEADRGLLRLPAPSPGDIFLDLEGDPFAGSSGLEYLFGWAVRDDDRSWRCTSRWALDADSEKAAFEAFMAEAMTSLERHPDLHIYHYAPYEPTALKRLMGRYASCADELDCLLRGEVLVDLHAGVRQTLIASVERYSIKKLEPFYGFTRATPLPEASQALRQVEYFLETGQSLPEDDPLRAAVESYNRDDCLSAAALRDWLEQLRDQVIASGTAVPRPTPNTSSPGEDTSERDVRVAALAAGLSAGVPADPESRSVEQQARCQLAQLLQFHRREEKAAWWDFFRVANLSGEERLEEPSALAGLAFVGPVDGKGRLPTHRYTFPPQECDIRDDARVYVSQDLQLGTVVDIDRVERTVDIKKTAKGQDLHPLSVFANQVVSSKLLGTAVERLGEWVADHGPDDHGPCRAARDLLLLHPPRLAPGTPWIVDGEPALNRARRLALALDEGTLPVQGPPGSGKTFTGARMVCELVRAGRRVGITAVSHKVIRKLLDEVVLAAAAESLDVQCVQKVTDDPRLAEGRIVEMSKADDVADALSGGFAQVAGGTAWLWAGGKLTDAVDVLVVDEAGQMSLANVLAVAQAARSLILLGDPQQLEQPLQAAHPDGTACSVLQHVLGDRQTLPPDRGLFLAETYRMHPAICAFTSELFYEGRLHAVAGLEQQALNAAGALSGAGLWVLPVAHEGNQNVSIEEADAVTALVRALIGLPRAPGTPEPTFGRPASPDPTPAPVREAGPSATAELTTWTDCKGLVHPLTLDDILIVAPYNAQVAAIRDRIHGARVGTVDRFQGQEAPVVICSMATSSADEAPRGMGFLYSLNRLNVATSRARCAVIAVASPALFAPECQTPGQMQMANAWCRYAEMAGRLTIDDSIPSKKRVSTCIAAFFGNTRTSNPPERTAPRDTLGSIDD